MIGKTLVKHIVSKDLYDDNVYVKIPINDIKKLIEDEIKIANIYNRTPDDIVLPINKIYDRKAPYSEENETILTVNTEYKDDMPF